MEDVLDSVPSNLLGYEIKTRTKIILSCLIPAILELIVYLFVTFADIACVYQHFYDANQFYAILTLVFLCAPALTCFFGVISCSSQWPSDRKCSYKNLSFLLRQFFNLFFFPIGAVHRFSRRIFWSIEALFHERHTFDRIHAVAKAAENSPFELYHFIQAFVQSGPQIILQLYILLREDMFRNFQTTTAQSISLVFSFITMAIIISSYQRFESQKIVGRVYPWASEEQERSHKEKLINRTIDPIRNRQTSTITEYPDVLRNFSVRYSESIASDHENEVRLRNNNKNNTNEEISRKTLAVDKSNFDENFEKNIMTDDEKFQRISEENLERNTTTSSDINMFYDTVDTDNLKKLHVNIPYDRNFSSITNNSNVPDDDLFEHIDDIRAYIEETDGELPSRITQSPKLNNRITEENFDVPPVSAPPPPPPSSGSEHKYFNFQIPFQRMSLIKDVLVHNTEQLIKDHVPRLPPNLFDKTEKHDETNTDDEVDGLRLPTSLKLISGIRQDDFIGKFVSFFGWILFLIMRILTISVFSVFYLYPTLHFLYAHYLLMVVCLFWETKFHDKIHRMFFYFFLGYVYIFSILEFKIKFNNVRKWYGGYFALVFIENIVMTMFWYTFADIHSWWYHYLFGITIGSGILSLGCLTFYFLILKPPIRTLLEKEEL